MATSPTSLAIKGFFYKTEVTPTSDGGLETVTLKSSTATGIFAPVTSTIIDKTGKAGNPTFDFPGTNAADRAAFSNLTSEESKSRNTQVGLTKPFGPNPKDYTAEQKTVINGASGKPNAATVNPNQPTTPAAATAEKALFTTEAATIKEGTRTSYSDVMRYPINLKLQVQDVIKFSILKYSPSLAKGNISKSGFGSGKSRVVTLDGDNPIIVGSERIGVITLPIPAGISDGNTVGWERDNLSTIQSEAATAAKAFFEEGIAGAGESLDNSVGKAQGAIASQELQTAVKAIFLDKLAQANITSRAFGAVLNNNAELLFSGPGLRSFSFTFLFYPREPKESIMVRQIIRAFKQAMSVKRSATSLLLKAPHTFAIQYMTAGQKAHPYLNRFKECALTSCSVDYTPDGTYMTYGGAEKSMTAYRLGLTFQELEPLFDDEYGPDDNIGF